MPYSLWPHGLQHARPPCPSPSPGAYLNSCPLSQWCHPTVSSSVVPFSSRLSLSQHQGFFPMSQLFTSGGQNTGASASASVLPMNIQGWFPLGWTGWISLLFKELSLYLNVFQVQPCWLEQLLLSFFSSVSMLSESLKLSYYPWPHLTLQVKCQLDFVIALNSFPAWPTFHSWTGDV